MIAFDQSSMQGIMDSENDRFFDLENDAKTLDKA